MNAIESSHLLKWYKKFWKTIKRPTTSVLKYFEKLGTNVSIKLHYLFSHLDRFPQNLGDFSDEQVERFHQGIKVMEERYQGRGDQHMMTEYCWNLLRDCPDVHLSRKSYKRKFLCAK